MAQYDALDIRDYWKYSMLIRHPQCEEEISDMLEEIEILASVTESAAVHARCIKLLLQHGRAQVEAIA